MQVISELFIHPSALHVRLAGGSTPRSTLLRINYCCSLLGLLIKKTNGFHSDLCSSYGVRKAFNQNHLHQILIRISALSSAKRGAEFSSPSLFGQ